MKTLQEAKDGIEAYMRSEEAIDPHAYKAVAMFAVFVRRDNGQAVVTESIGDPALVKALLRELSDQIQPSAIVVPDKKIILPHQA